VNRDSNPEYEVEIQEDSCTSLFVLSSTPYDTLESQKTRNTLCAPIVLVIIFICFSFTFILYLRFVFMWNANFYA
jgi:hypothetical protein